MIRRFLVIGQKATSSEDFVLDDIPGTSGRLDVLVRCVRAAFLSSHGLRRDVVVYFVLLGGPLAPRLVRLDGTAIRFLRPDERSSAVLLKKVLASRDDEVGGGFVTVRPGITVARGGLELVLADASGATVFVLEENASDIRETTDIAADDVLFVVGDHLGVSDEARAALANVGARAVSIGPVSVHADDTIAVVTNELDRRVARSSGS